MPQNVDKQRYEASVSRLHDIFRDISDTTTEVSTWRCPYKNVEDRCTAAFGCRNQERRMPPGEMFICTADDRLDYRGAWEV